ncbi:hypothetical protein GGI07_004726 [Coemansia sp. Benny D115]|nr:hypothetical protein GGI07_004726 [Coemansia sp. Benny D115]
MSYKRELARSLYALSTSGSHLAVAHSDRYMLLERPEEGASINSNYRLVSVGTDASLPGESVTAIHCMNVYTPQSGQKAAVRGASLCMVVGYSSGYLRIYSHYGHLLTSHQFHSHPLIRIRLRMPSLGEGSTGSHGNGDDSEEVGLTYADGTVVNIDGKSLYLALRLCLNEATSAEADEPVFQYKKWAFDLNTPLVADAISYGPAYNRDPLSSIAKPSFTSNPVLNDATARFLVAPKHGDATFGVFMTNEDAAVSVSAVEIAGKMAAKVTGAVLNIAKSYFWRSSPRSSTRGGDNGGYPEVSSGASEAGTMVACAFAVRDSPRKVLDISLAPASYGLAALTDSLGRVMLFDLETCEVVHMLKGLRGSQCAWLEVKSGDSGPSDGARRRMFIVVYAGRRGTVDIFELGSLERPVASVSVGLGWKLVQCPTQPLGGSLVVGSAESTRRALQPLLSSCMLISESGYIATLDLRL